MGILKTDETISNKPQMGSASVGGFNAILDQGSEFEGKLTFQGTVRIDGTFKGEIFSKSHIESVFDRSYSIRSNTAYTLF